MSSPTQSAPSAGASRAMASPARAAAARAHATTLAPIRVLPVPRCEPEFVDGDLSDGPPAGPAYVQDALAIDPERVSDEELFGPQATPADDLPDPAAWAGQIAQAVVEVMTGSRPAPQVIRWLTPEVYAVVARRGALVARRQARGVRDGNARTRRALVRRVHVCEPCPGIVEASVVVIDGRRVRALAMRLVGQDGRWRVEALQIS